jgi:iron complex transport system ATP-binding protein
MAEEDAMMDLALMGVSVAVGGAKVLSDVTLTVRPGEVVALLGPNGAGKTTLLRAALGLIAVDAGTVRLGGDDPRALPPAARARRCAYLPQTREASWPVRVRDVVALGRFAHGAAPHRLSPPDRAAVDEAIAACDLGPLSARRIDELSGGEQARVHIARALAAHAPLVLADEPAAALDPLHQDRVMRLLARFAREGGAALVVMHDPTLAARHADRLVWMAGGRIVNDGPPRATLTPDTLARVYGVRAEVIDRPDGPVAVILGDAAPAPIPGELPAPVPGDPPTPVPGGSP